MSPAGQRFPPGWAAMSSSSRVSASPERRTPVGVRSNAQAKTMVSGKPSTSSHTTSVTVQSGSDMRGRITSAASITANETAPYTAMTRNTRRRFISAKNLW